MSTNTSGQKLKMTLGLPVYVHTTAFSILSPIEPAWGWILAMEKEQGIVDDTDVEFGSGKDIG